MSTEKEPFKQWAIVELFGHARIAGLVGEQTIGGCSFLRVDVPEIVVGDETLQPVTKLYGQGAIYAISFVDEQTAIATAKEIRFQPVSVWSLRRGLEAMSPSDRQRALGYDGDDEGPF